ncbi:hypothetical protein CYMTET_7314 [Cymbomonas tetramitiformis]|uniref:Reverse transcriptase domain-containing protein n=1 Tax=Cymbomonas tetramitiformis TaxID=36881 RepID=A0AAE0LH04_9CHLO|nr:hypothetical protein CYMTET_7314 [Cymbomonas tetramitiformis]
MQRALGHLPFVRIFIDDVVVFSSGDIEEHYRFVREFLLTCREKGVYLKKSKAQMLKKNLRFLGHTLSSKGCQPQHDKVAAVRDWPALQNVTHIRQFYLGTGWLLQEQWSFDELKAALVKAPVLALPDMKAAADGSAPFVVQTDASGIALGGVLMQDCGGGLGVIAQDTARLKKAGVLDGKSDLPRDPLSVLDSSVLFEEGPTSRPAHRLAEVVSWLDAVDALQTAEQAIEQATLAYKAAIPPIPHRYLEAAGRTGRRARQQKTQVAAPGGEVTFKVGPTQRPPAAAKARSEDPAEAMAPEIGVPGCTRSRTGQKTRATDTHAGDVAAEVGPITRRPPVRAEPRNPAEVVTSEVGSPEESHASA